MKAKSFFSAVLVSALWLLAATPAGAFCERRADFCEALPDQCLPASPHVYCHEEITEEGLAFMRPALVEEVVEGNLHNDHEHKNIQSSHFDGCDFDGGAEEINGIYNSAEEHLAEILSFCVPFSCDSILHQDRWGVVAMLDPDNPKPILASHSFGLAMHAVQDLYSHSNWVQLHRYTDVYMTAEQMPLIESSIGPWVMQPWAPLPAAPSVLQYLHVERVTLADEDGFGDDWEVSGLPYVPLVEKPDGVKYAPVISGTSLAEDECPDGLKVDHSGLHKDDPNVDIVVQDNYRKHEHAGKLAVRQTGQEWCRILHLTKDRFGFAGTSVPMGLWVAGNAPERGPGSPHPALTSCQETLPGPVEITADVDQIRVLDDLDPEDANPGDLKLVLVLYTHDLTRSSRSQVGPLVVNSGDFIADEASPGPVTLCLTEEQANAMAATVQGWDNDNPEEDLDPGDQALRGVHVDGLGLHTVSSEDLEVTIDVRRSSTDLDGDGLPLCDEIVRGTDPGNAYSDEDDLTDGEEVALGTDPLDEDTDNDGAEDGDDNCPTVSNVDQVDYEADGVGDACDEDEDNDGVVDADDAFPHSDVSPTVAIDSCDSGVPNEVLASGSTFMDLIGQCVASTPPPGELVSCVSTLTSGWLRRGLIRKQEKAAIVKCAAFEAPAAPRPSATRTWMRR